MSQTNKVGVLGLGYVGLPLVLLCAKKGLEVVGFDTDKGKIERLRKGVCALNEKFYIDLFKKFEKKIDFSSDPNCLKKCEVYIICVPTPINSNATPNLSYVEAAVGTTLPFIENKLIIIESTVYPGTLEEVVTPILNKSGKKSYLAHCPERINPGDPKWNIENIPRVVAGCDKESLDRAYNFYNRIINAEIKKVSNLKTAEAVKLFENTFRDVNIAFVNEMAKSFDKFGIDIKDVIAAASSKPFGFLAHYPGCGVGGHCIAVDPYYLIEKAKTIGFDHKFLKLAREINESMPEYTVDLLADCLKRYEATIRGAKIGLLGISYKKNVADKRESPFFKIKKLLEEQGAKLYFFDPYVKELSNTASIDELLAKVDYIILITEHDWFVRLPINKFKQHNIKAIVDGRNCLDGVSIERAGIIYNGIGR